MLPKLFLAGIAALALTLSSCNTVAGAGQDVEQLGEGLEEAARDAQY